MMMMFRITKSITLDDDDDGGDDGDDKGQQLFSYFGGDHDGLHWQQHNDYDNDCNHIKHRYIHYHHRHHHHHHHYIIIVIILIVVHLCAQAAAQAW